MSTREAKSRVELAAKKGIARASIMQLRVVMCDAFDYAHDDIDAKVRCERARKWSVAAEEAFESGEWELATTAASRAIGIMEGNL